MTHNDLLELVRAASLVELRILNTDVRTTPGGDSVVTRVELQLGDPDEADDVAWATFGLLYALGLLSFHDARPRGVSGRDFVPGDEFTVTDLLTALRYERGELHLETDYLRGRCMKTDVFVRPDGRVTIETRNRGDAVLRWLDRLQGKQILTVLPGAEGSAGTIHEDPPSEPG